MEIGIPETYFTPRGEVFSIVAQEIERAEKEWGHEFDKKNTLNDWVAYAQIYVGKAVEMGATQENIEKNLRKAAGILISALVQQKVTGFAPRHYEGQERPKSLPEIGKEK
jgi:hypothetical protein